MFEYEQSNEGSSRMKRKFHVRFLEEVDAATRLLYSTKIDFVEPRIKLLCKITVVCSLGNVNLYKRCCDLQEVLKKRKKSEPSIGLIVNSVLIVLILICSTNSLVYAKAGSGEKGWVIHQSSNFAGTVFSDLTDHALKMHIGKLGLTIITKAPKWNALVFSENTKSYVDLPYKRWQQRFTIGENSNYRDPSSKTTISAHDSGKVMQVGNVKTYECVVVKKGDPVRDIPDEKVSQLWIASDIKAPSQIAQLFCSHLGIPAQKGIPLKANRCVNGKMVSALETLSVERRFIPASTFEPLTGYRKVKDELELVMSKSTNEEMADLLDVSQSVKSVNKK